MNNINSLQTLASSAAIEKINQDWIKLQSLGGDLIAAKISLVNLAREIGITCIGLCGHEQMKLSFYENIKAMIPAGMTFNAVRKCIQIAHAMPEPATCLEDANAAEQYAQLALNLIDEPKRTEQQIAKTVSLYTYFNSIFCDAKEKLFKKLKESDAWDNHTKESIRQQVQSFRKALADIEAKL